MNPGAVLISVLLSTAPLGPPPSQGPAPSEHAPIVVLVSADMEWKAVRALVPEATPVRSPFGEWFLHDVTTAAGRRRVLLFHGGWGKIAAAGSTQYAIDRWKPRLLVNLGTCGGFRGAVEKGEILLVDKTVVYDIVEQMGDAAEAIADYTTPVDVAWIGKGLPAGVRQGPIVSADRDILPADIPRLRESYGAVAGDWESGAIAWIAARNHVPVLILRGVSDLVGADGDETYGNLGAFEAGARRVMKGLLEGLPFWLERFDKSARPASAARGRPKQEGAHGLP
jgi:adenosylhomocysteine nucleosidase